MTTLRDMIERNALWYGDQLAYRCGQTSVTHREFRDQAWRIASSLHALGVRSQDRVAILSMNSVEFALTYGACEAHGLIAATVNFRLAAPEMRYIINDGGAGVLVFEAEFTGLIDQIRAELPDVREYICIGEAPSWATPWEAFVAGGDPAGPPLPPPTPDDLVYLIYTSGTTGRPKGCALPQSAEVALAATTAGAMGLGSEDSMLLMMPLFHIGAKAMALGQQWVGGAVHLHRKFDPVEVLRTIAAEKITATHMAPVLIQGLLEAPGRERFDLKSLRTVLYSAAAMPPSLLREALNVFGPVFQQMYGQTEGVATVLPIGAHQPDGDAKAQRRLTSVGHPFIGFEVTIRDDENQPLPPESIGEICVRGPTNMQGYWNNSAATLTTLAGGWLHTGDVGLMDEDGYLYLVDRKKDVIISGGENIYSREVEEALIAHPDIAAAAVIGAPDPKWGEIVCAVVALRPGAALTEADIETHCRTLIAGFKRPRKVIFVDEIPLLPSGKINKPVLRAAYAQ